MNYTLQAKNICKSFNGGVVTQVLSDISLAVHPGEFVAIVGKSGCGKSTLLYILSTMDTDYKGQLFIDNELITGASSNKLAALRNEKIGFVFQFHYLLNEFTVLQNVMLPAMKSGRHNEKEIAEQGLDWLKLLGIDQLKNQYPNQLSGGEKQRVAIARALINKPLIIMGDEPTGNLDKKNTEIVFHTFKMLASELKQSLLIVTHDLDFAARADRIIEMDDGRIVGLNA